MGFPDSLPLMEARDEKVTPVRVGAALPLRETEGDAEPLLVREGVPLKDALTVGERDAEELLEEGCEKEGGSEAVTPETVAAAEDVMQTVPETEGKGDSDGQPDTEGLPDASPVAEAAPDAEGEPENVAPRDAESAGVPLLAAVAMPVGDLEASTVAVTGTDRVKAAEEAIGDTVADSVLARLGDADAEATVLVEPAGETEVDAKGVKVRVAALLKVTSGDSVAEAVLLCETLPDAEDAAVIVPPLGVNPNVCVIEIVPLWVAHIETLPTAVAEAAALRVRNSEDEKMGELDTETNALAVLNRDGELTLDAEGGEEGDTVVVAESTATVAVTAGDPVARDALAAAESEGAAEGLRAVVRDTRGLAESLV